MNERDQGDRAYYTMPGVGWETIGEETREALRSLTRFISTVDDAISAEAVGDVPSPLEVATRLNEVANRLFGAAGGADRDLRQVITTLRTALAVCWDMYSASDAGRVSVRAHMQQLQAQIEDFERELSTWRAAAPDERR